MSGLPLPAASDLWCLLAPVLSGDELIAAGDFIITPPRRFEAGGGRGVALATLQELERAMHRHAGGSGSALLRRALPYVRSPVDSPAETWLRLTIVGAGFAEPVVNCAVPVDGRTLHADLGYPALRIAIEYEGRHHFRGGEAMAARDVERWEAMSAAGWRVLRVTAVDRRNPRRFLHRLAAVIAERSH